MTVSTYIAKFLKSKGINTVFELQGGMITRILDAIHQEGGIQIVSMHHEQAAAMAADAYGRITNKPGVALGTSGPGATNLLTGIGNCHFDSVPAIFITGQVNLNEQKGNSSTRQIGFQETDIVSMAIPITKKAIAIKTKKEIPFVLEEAFQIAVSGRPGPVLIDIPMNFQNEEIEINDVIFSPPKPKAINDNIQTFINKFTLALRRSKKPLVLVGRGVRSSAMSDQFLEFLKINKIPVVTSLLGLDTIPYNHPQRIGFIGTYGNRWANYALGNCDLLLVLGSRLDLRQTGSDIPSFQSGKEVFHVDIENVELNNRIKGCETLNVDLSYFFDQANSTKFSFDSTLEWKNEIEEKKQSRLDTKELENITGINPNIFLHQLSQASKNAVAFTADTGNNQMWSAQSLELSSNQVFLTSGGMGAMGYSLPAAIGTSIALGNKPVVCITGDGGFQINIQELQTIKRNKLPVKIIVLNNHCLGMIRQFQDAYFDSCYQSTVWGYDSPDFTRVAQAYGIESYNITRENEIAKGLNLLWGDPDLPFLLNVEIDIHTNVFPKTMFGSSIANMEPKY
jgi:acetolactate synthase I/II/III large subunit